MEIFTLVTTYGLNKCICLLLGEEDGSSCGVYETSHGSGPSEMDVETSAHPFGM